MGLWAAGHGAEQMPRRHYYVCHEPHVEQELAGVPVAYREAEGVPRRLEQGVEVPLQGFRHGHAPSAAKVKDPGSVPASLAGKVLPRMEMVHERL